MARLVALALLAGLVAFPAAADDALCHDTPLGSQRCSGELRPPPRPVIRADTSALERMRDRPVQDPTPEIFVPAGNRNRLGTTKIDAPGPISTCKPDTLGNLRCR